MNMMTREKNETAAAGDDSFSFHPNITFRNVFNIDCFRFKIQYKHWLWSRNHNICFSLSFWINYTRKILKITQLLQYICFMRRNQGNGNLSWNCFHFPSLTAHLNLGSQNDTDDQSKKSDGRSENLNNQNPYEQRRICSIG